MESTYKLIFAILQEDDYDSTVEELTQNQIFVTKLSSTGGFFKKRNITIMMGVETAQLEKVLEILRTCAGHRQGTTYMMPVPSSSADSLASGSPIPVQMDLGGVTVFVLNMDQLQKF